MHSSSRVRAYISTQAIKNNITQIRNSIPEESLLMGVIKADGYGHGAITVARCIESYTDYFAVATIEEALELRESGLKKPILILGYTFPEAFEAALENDITLTIFTREDAALLSEKAAVMNVLAKIHIAVDTGMGRIGFFPEEKSADIVKEISEMKNICTEGVFTHFSTADEKDFSFTKLQTERFLSFRKMLEERNVNIKLYHAANSGAIMQHKETLSDMVRAGIILYGLYPSEDVDKNTLSLIPVMELHSKVAYVKTVKKGDDISYGRTFTAKEDMKIATIPVGYADGYPRLLSNKGRVIINGEYAPIVGRICMDQFMVDVTNIKNVDKGTDVVLIGKQGKCSISSDEIAKLAGTINYEVVCDISKRVPREVI